MFQRLRDAIDNRIVEEQTRQRAAVSPSPKARPPRRPSPRDSSPSKSPDPTSFDNEVEQEESGKDGMESADPGVPPIPAAGARPEEGASRGELPTDIRVKLRKLERLEGRYNELLRVYRIAHSRVQTIEPFEASLRENTPLTSISDPSAFLEYLNQISLKSDMVIDELKRITEERNDWRDKFTARKEAPDSEEATGTSPAMPSTNEAKDPSKNDDNFFSYDDEVPRLQEELQERQSEVATLNEKVSSIQEELQEQQSEVTVLNERLLGVQPLKESLSTTQGELQERQSEVAMLNDKVSGMQQDLQERQSEVVGLNERLSRMQSPDKTPESLRDTSEQAEEKSRALQSKVDVLEQELANSSNKDTERILKEKLAASEAGLQEVKGSLIAMTQTEDEKAEGLAWMKAEAGKFQKRVVEAERMMREHETTAANLPSSRYFGFVNSDEFDLTGDDQEAFRKFSAILKTSRPGLHAALTGQPVGPGEPDDAKKPKKKKKKKNKTQSPQTLDPSPSKVTEMVDEEEGTSEMQGLDRLQVLEGQIQEKDSAIDRLSAKLKDQSALAEEIETLRDDLLHQGEEHVEAREALRLANLEKASLKNNLADLENGLREESKKLRSECVDLRTQLESTQKDLAAAESLAASRFKDVTDSRDALAKAQLELRKTRSEVGELTAAKEGLQIKAAKLTNLERHEEELKNHVKKLDRRLEEKDGDLNTLRSSLADAMRGAQKARDELAAANQELRNAQISRDDALQSQQRTSATLEDVRAQSTLLRKRAEELDSALSSLRAESTTMKDELGLKASLHDASQGVVTGLREQLLELTIQAREAVSRADSLEEEHSEAQRMLSERSREAETMRRLVSEVETRTSSKLKVLKERLQSALEERDRIDDEASTNHRRMARELDVSKNRERETLKALKLCDDEKEELLRSEKSLKRRHEELESAEEKAKADLGPLQVAVQQLREALDQRENETSEFERQNTESKRRLQDLQNEVEQLRKTNSGLAEDLKTRRRVGRQERPSLDSPSRNSLALESRTTDSPATDVAYLKNVFLQFLEQKDKNNQKRLVPVLSSLLKFDGKDEQKWMAAINTR